MPRERLPMRKIRDVLRLHAGGLSKRRIAASLTIGRTAVGDYIRRAKRAGLGWPLAEGLADEDLDRLLFPPAPVVYPRGRPPADWPALHRELKRPGVTLSLLSEEYRAVHPDGYGYSQFCARYRAWKGKLDVTMRQSHVAGEKMFNLAIRWEYRADNPVTGLVFNPEPPRHRYLTEDEIRRLTAVLADHPNRRCANVIRLLLLTGARKGEVMKATWDQFDLEGGVWTKPSSHTKQRREHRVPLSAAVVALLRGIREGQPRFCRFVFPGDPPDHALTEISTFWEGVRRKADIPDVRMHDLRHTYASILVSSGLSLPIIGALLGHTQPQTTARYSHLFDHPLREATERVSAVVVDFPVAAERRDCEDASG